MSYFTTLEAVSILHGMRHWFSVESVEKEAFVVAFDGHGDENTGDNKAFIDLVSSISEHAFFFSSGIGCFPTNRAYDSILRRYSMLDGSQCSEDNPRVHKPIILLGYSSGAVDAIKLIRRLQNTPVTVSCLISFDPRSPLRLPLLGATRYNFSDTVPALNFYQRGRFHWPINPFRGARLLGDHVININVTDIAGHNNMIRKVMRLYPHLLSEFLDQCIFNAGLKSLQ